MARQLITVGTIAAMTVVHPAAAADRPAELGEIVVTAQKREQALNEVPMSVTAFSGDDAAAAGAVGIEDLQYKIPGFSLVNFYPGGQQYQLRGVSANLGLPTVGIYVDEMPINSNVVNANLEFDLYDLERIEVLRGPQGTLYGEGSMGGTIKYVTAPPGLDAFAGHVGTNYAFVEAGDPNWRLEGTLNAPIVSDVLGVRISASHQETGGWIDNTVRGEKDVNSGERTNVRTKILWKPSDDTSASLLYVHGNVDVDNATFSLVDRLSAQPVASPISDSYDLLNLVLSHDFGGVTLLSSTGWLDRASSIQLDLSTFFVPFLQAPPPFGLGLPPGTVTGVGASSEVEYETLTQELRLSSSGQTRLRWTVGAYYRDYSDSNVGGSFTQPTALPFTISLADTRNESESWAVFGEVSYAWTERLELTLGARYFEDTRRQNSSSTFIGFPSVDINEGSFTSTNPRAAVLYRFAGGSSLYASAAKGFRSGGFNLQSAGGGLPVPATFDPESLWSYEVGGVFTPADTRLLLQWAVYYNDWKDVQTLAVLPGSPFTITANGGKASGPGVDLQMTYQPNDALELAASLGWNDMEYKSTTPDKQSGDPMDFVAPLTGSLSATYRFPMGGQTTGFVRGDAQYTDSYEVNLRNFLPAAVVSESRTLLRAAFGVTHGPWDGQVYVDNALDEDKVMMPSYGTLSEPVRTAPRSIGVTLNRRF
jgi:outer membrane receptor protein involved in Fe transport